MTESKAREAIRRYIATGQDVDRAVDARDFPDRSTGDPASVSEFVRKERMYAARRLRDGLLHLPRHLDIEDCGWCLGRYELAPMVPR